MKSTISLKLVVLCIVSIGAILGFATYLKSGNLQAKNEYSSLNAMTQVSQKINTDVDVKFLKNAAAIRFGKIGSKFLLEKRNLSVRRDDGKKLQQPKRQIKILGA